MDSLVPLFIITVLILLNGLFVAAEFAIVGTTRASIDRLAARGNRGARTIQLILRDPRGQDRFIATAQLGITLSSLGLGMYGEHVLAAMIAGWLEGWGPPRWIAAHSVAAVVSITVLTYFHIVIGEMVPKSLALQKAERTALWITPIMRAVQRAMYPLVIALNGIGNGLLLLVGVRRSAGGDEQVRTPEDLAYIVRESEAGGLLRRGAAEVVQELLDFGDRTAGEVMVPRVRVVGIPLGASAEYVRDTLRSAPHTRYPVFDGSLDRIVGMLHVKDVARGLPAGSAITRESARPAPFIPATARMDRVLTTLRQTRSEAAVVMDEYGGTAGILTVEDLFEEIVGEFADDPDAPMAIWRDGDGHVYVTGTVRLDELGAEIERVLEHEAVDTVSGLVIDRLGRPPVPGDVVTYQGVRLEVRRVEGNGVAECAVTIVGPASDANRPEGERK